ncbi:MAG: CHAT domain-containing protein [Neomegalonema sp.]|nr:CHAT domain-containing protein [Neomegalonema sp.]
MALPPGIAAQYRTFVMPDLARAVRLAQGFIEGEALPDFSTLSDDTVWMLYLRLSELRMLHKAEFGVEDPRLEQAQARAEAARVARQLQEPAPASDMPDMNRVTRGQDALDRARKALARDDIAAATEALAHARSSIPATNPAASARLHMDRADLAYQLADFEAELCNARDDWPAAEAAHLSALEAAKVCDRWDLRSHRRLRAAHEYAEDLRTRNPDRFLTVIRPYFEAALSEPPSVAQVNFKNQMMAFHRQTLDWPAALNMRDMIVEDLAALGFQRSQRGDYYDVVGQWIAAAEARGRSAIERANALKEALLVFVAIEATEAQALDDDRAERRMQALDKLFQELLAVEIATQNEANSYLADALGETGVFVQKRPFTIPHNRNDGRTLFEVAMARYERGERSDELRGELRTISDSASLDPAYRGEAYLRRAYWAEEEGAASDAIALNELAHQIAKDFRFLELDVRSRLHRAVMAASAGDWRAASTFAGDAICQIEHARSMLHAPYAATMFMADKWNAYALGVNAARKIGDLPLMLKRMELLKARELTTRPEVLSSDEAVGLRAALATASKAARATTNKQVRETLQARRRLYWDQLQIIQPRPPLEFDAAALQARLGDKATALSYFMLDPAVLLITVITGDAIRVERLAIEPDGPFHRALCNVRKATPGQPVLEIDAEDLAAALLPEAIAPDIAAAKQLIICLHQRIHDTPIAALPWRGAPLIEHCPVGLTPNLTCLLRDPAKQNGRGLFAVATREATGPDGEALPPLDAVEREARAAAALFAARNEPAHLRLGENAVADWIDDPSTRAAAAEARVLHFGLHGGDVAAPELENFPMESKLFFRDGPLDGLDLSGLRLKCELVVLAACYAARRATSARGLPMLPADTVYGLRAAFHQAGAGAIFGALWPADDAITPRVTAALYAALQSGQTLNQAARSAILTYLAEADPIERKIRYWGCFALAAFGPEAFGLTGAPRSNREVRRASAGSSGV